MKKINVSKLIELKKKELDARDLFSRVMKKKELGYTVTEQEIANLNEKCQIIRNDFETVASKLTEAIETVEGKAVVRKIDAQDIICALMEVNDFLSISKKAMVGTRVRIDCNAQNFPNAYKWVPQSTIFLAEFTKSGWTVTDIYRGTAMRKKVFMLMSDTAKEAYLNKAVTLGE